MVATQGRIIGVEGSIAEVFFATPSAKPHDILTTTEDVPVLLEVIGSASPQSLYCLILTPNQPLVRGSAVVSSGHPLQVPVGAAVLGRAIDIFGHAHDGKPDLPSRLGRPLFTRPARDLHTLATPTTMVETGIKAIDFFTPLLRGGKAALIGGAGVGKTVILTELAQRLVIERTDTQGVAVFSAVGERSREAQELYDTLAESGVLARTTLVLGQMGESPAIRFRTAFAGVAMAEYFRDEEKLDVLYYMDNLFRFTQAGHELATITNSIPSEDGYQATLTSEMASLNERLYSTTTASVTSFMALFVPADDFTDAGVRAAFPFLDTTIFLSREVFQSGRYPAIDFLASTSSALTPAIAGTKHYRAYIQAKQTLERAAELTRIVSLVGEGELSSDNQRVYQRAQRIINFMTQDLYLTKAETGHPEVSVPREETVRVVAAILSGALDDVAPERLRYIDRVETQKILISTRRPVPVAPASTREAAPAPVAVQ